MDGIQDCFSSLSERMRREVIKYAQSVDSSVRSLSDMTPEIADTLLSTDYFGWGGSLAYCISDHGKKVRAALRQARDFRKTQDRQRRSRLYEAASSFGLTIRGADPEDAHDLVKQLGDELSAPEKDRKQKESDGDDEFPF